MKAIQIIFILFFSISLFAQKKVDTVNLYYKVYGLRMPRNRLCEFSSSYEFSDSLKKYSNIINFNLCAKAYYYDSILFHKYHVSELVVGNCGVSEKTVVRCMLYNDSVNRFLSKRYLQDFKKMVEKESDSIYNIRYLQKIEEIKTVAKANHIPSNKTNEIIKLYKLFLKNVRPY